MHTKNTFFIRNSIFNEDSVFLVDASAPLLVWNAWKYPSGTILQVVGMFEPET